MDSPDPSDAVSSVIRILRKATRLVQLAPFAYLVFYAVYILACSFVPDELLSAADAIMFASPATTGGMLVASRLFKLCRWHKAACLIPFSSQLEGYIDEFLGTAIAVDMQRRAAEAEGLRGGIAGVGDHVPGGTAAADVIQRGDPPGQVERLAVGA